MAKRNAKDKASEPLIIHDEQGEVIANYPADLLDTIKSTVAKGATNEELYMFLSIAKQYDLNPFLKEIWFVKMKDDFTIMTSRDGYRKLAMREPTFLKCQSETVHENDIFEIERVMGEVTNITHKYSHKDRGNLVGAYAVLKTTSMENYVTYVDFREYDKRNQVWKQYPSSMIKKVAENDVYKKFANINGVQDFESMPRQYNRETPQDIIKNSNQEEIIIDKVPEEVIDIEEEKEE